MSAPRRWIRLDVGWDASDWLADLSPGARLSWVMLLGYTKSAGVGGKVKAMGIRGAARTWCVPAEDVAAMLAAAQEDGALVASGDTWELSGWDKYQQPDGTAAERKRKQRNKLAETPVTGGHGMSQDVTVGHGMSRVTTVTGGVTCHVTETETETEEKHPSDAKRKRAGRRERLPEGWAPNEGHATKADTLGLALAEQADAFREYHGGKGTVLVDWDLGFHTWLRNAVRFARGPSPTPAKNGQPQGQPRYHMTAAEVKELYG